MIIDCHDHPEPGLHATTGSSSKVEAVGKKTKKILKESLLEFFS